MRRRKRSLAEWIALGVGVVLIVIGLWAFTSPRSFFDSLATWPPFNKHFIHDIGAFQIGLGTILLLAIARTDALFVALAGAAVGATFHFLAHLFDRDLGGRSTDPILFGILAGLLIVAAYTRYRSPRGLDRH